MMSLLTEFTRAYIDKKERNSHVAKTKEDDTIIPIILQLFRIGRIIILARLLRKCMTWLLRILCGDKDESAGLTTIIESESVRVDDNADRFRQ
jgi:hypothetical protein